MGQLREEMATLVGNGDVNLPPVTRFKDSTGKPEGFHFVNDTGYRARRNAKFLCQAG